MPAGIRCRERGVPRAGPERKTSVLNRPPAVVFPDDARLEFDHDPLQELPVPAVRRERCGEHMVADHVQRPLAVPLAIAVGRLPNVGFRRRLAAGQALGNEDQNAADYCGHIPGGDRRIDPGECGSEKVHNRKPVRNVPVDYRLHQRLRIPIVTMSPWTISPHSDAMRSWRTTGESWRRT